MEHLDKRIQEIKGILEKEHGREFSWEEATLAMGSLKKFAALTYDIFLEEQRRQDILKEHPKGFHFDRTGYPCFICGKLAERENSWFDEHGLKCMICQKAINSKIIPGSVAKDKESWYSQSDLYSYFNFKYTDINKYIKQGLLKVRTIPNEANKVHLQLFLIKDNKSVLPPKALLKSRIVKEISKGEEYQVLEQWYQFIDLKQFKRLEKYKIMGCLKETLARPIEGGRFLVKHVNPLFTPKVSG